MYERMLNKQKTPSFDELIDYAGENGIFWTALNEYLMSEFEARSLIRFPYGNHYGWGVKYSRKNKHICDVFAESGAFTAHFRIANKTMDTVHNRLNDYAKDLWKHKYPCGDGRWLNFRVLNSEHLEALKIILGAKINEPR